MNSSNNDISLLRPFLDHHGIQILDQSRGYIECVGTHTTPDRPGDCKVFVNAHGVPWIHCFHTSCRSEIERLNADLVRWFRWKGLGNTPAQRGNRWAANQAARSATQKLREKAQRELPRILQHYHWPYSAICTDSPEKVSSDVPEHGYLPALFADDDIVWIGRDVHDTGSPGHRWRFRPALQWMAEPKCPGTFICPSAFKPGVHSRCDANVLVPRYLVVESDILDRNQIGAIFRWLEKEAHLDLHAVVDTAGKSLHGWFKYPPPELLKKLKVILPAMGCDPALFKPSQPCRLPGAIRDGKSQTLIYITL